MTTAKEILFHLDNDEYVCIESNSRYEVLSPDKDEKGNYRTSGWRSTKEAALQNLGDDYGYAIEEIENRVQHWTIVDTWARLPKPLEIGTKVRVKDNAKEECEKQEYDFHSTMNEMTGTVYEVQSIDGGTLKINGLWFIRSAVTVVYEDQEKPSKNCCVHCPNNV